jgi:hypothetical protein
MPKPYYTTKTYRAWGDMHQRVHNPRCRQYPYYGGRGISIDPRWDSYPNFLADMGEALPGLTLDRIDVDGDYGPGNCRWDTWKAQALNKRRRGMQKLVPEQVIAIRKDPRSYATIALTYGVSKSAINHIKHRRVWGHVP